MLTLTVSVHYLSVTEQLTSHLGISATTRYQDFINMEIPKWLINPFIDNYTNATDYGVSYF